MNVSLAESSIPRELERGERATGRAGWPAPAHITENMLATDSAYRGA
jgi:hypothetical protein